MKLSSLFCDHAVIQRGISVPVWGWTKPLRQVRVTLGPYEAESLSGADGKFTIRLPSMPAGGPFDLEVTGGGGAVVAKDVWVGEVWLASGHSNMEFTLSALKGKVNEDALAQTDTPRLRMITVPREACLGRQSDVAAGWQVSTPENAQAFSAVGYYFAKRLCDELGVAVGIVNASWGGTTIEAWTSREALVRNPDTAAWVARYEATINEPVVGDGSSTLPVSKYPADPGNEREASGWAGCDFDDSAWAGMQLPKPWQAAGHHHSGVFWFRKTVEIPAAWAGRDLILGIGAVDKHDITYFNGVKVGATGVAFDDRYWNQVREYRVAGRLVRAGRNVITVRVYSFVYLGGMIGPADTMRIGPVDEGTQSMPLAGIWRYRKEHDLGVVAEGGNGFGPNKPNSPYILYDSMIAPLVPYGLRGAIWYQGESNLHNSTQYKRMLTEMIGL